MGNRSLTRPAAHGKDGDEEFFRCKILLDTTVAMRTLLRSFWNKQLNREAGACDGGGYFCEAQ